MAFNASVSVGVNVTHVRLLMVTEGIADDCETWSGKQIVGTVKCFGVARPALLEHSGYSISAYMLCRERRCFECLRVDDCVGHVHKTLERG